MATHRDGGEISNWEERPKIYADLQLNNVCLRHRKMVATNNSIYCPNCRANTTINVTAEEDYRSSQYTWQIGECNSCEQRFLVLRAGNSNSTIVRVWPKALPKIVDKSIPEAIRFDLEEAHRSMTVEAFRGAATLARRAMQSIALDQGAPTTKDIITKADKKRTVKMDLIGQIDWLEENRIITPQLQKWAHEVRTIGNKGAHPADADDKESVTQADAEDVIELVEAVCSTLYITNQRYQNRHADSNVETDSSLFNVKK